MIRADPGDFYDGVGWSQLTMNNDRIENEYIMWGRKQVFATGISGPELFAEPAADSAAADRRQAVPILREDGHDC